MSKIIIFGNGNHAQSVAKVLIYEGIKVTGFCVDDKYFTKPYINGKPVFKLSEILSCCPPEKYKFFLPLSFKNNCKFREKKFNDIKSLGYEFFTFISKNAQCYSEMYNIGHNIYLGALAAIHPEVIIGNNVYISEGAKIGHNSIIKSHSFISGNVVINGSCIIGERVTLGANAVIREGISIADGTVIGMGVAVHRDITSAKTYIFSPLYEKHYGRYNSKKI